MGADSINRGGVAASTQVDRVAVAVFRPRCARHARREARIIMGGRNLGVELEVFARGQLHGLAAHRHLRIVLAVGGVLVGVTHDGERGVHHLDRGLHRTSGDGAGNGHRAGFLSGDDGLGRGAESAFAGVLVHRGDVIVA